MPIVRQPILTQIGDAMQMGSKMYQGYQRGKQARDALAGLGLEDLSKFVDPMTGDMSDVGKSFIKQKFSMDAADLKFKRDKELVGLRADANARAFEAREILRNKIEDDYNFREDKKMLRRGMDPYSEQSIDFKGLYKSVFGDDAGIDSADTRVQDALENHYIDPVRHPMPKRKKVRGAGIPFWASDDIYEYEY